MWSWMAWSTKSRTTSHVLNNRCWWHSVEPHDSLLNCHVQSSAAAPERESFEGYSIYARFRKAVQVDGHVVDALDDIHFFGETDAAKVAHRIVCSATWSRGCALRFEEHVGLCFIVCGYAITTRFLYDGHDRAIVTNVHAIIGTNGCERRWVCNNSDTVGMACSITSVWLTFLLLRIVLHLAFAIHVYVLT